MADPRFSGAASLKAVETKPGQFVLEKIAEIHGGSGEADLFSRGHALDWLSFYCESTDTSGADSRVLRCYMAIKGTGGSGVAAQFRGELTATGAATGVGGLDGWGEVAAAAEMPTGLVYGVCAAVIADARTGAKTLSGTYWALFLASCFGTNITTSEQSAFIGFQDWGGGDAMPYLLDTAGLTSAAGNAYVAGAHAGTTVGGVYRVRTGFGTGYIKIYSD